MRITKYAVVTFLVLTSLNFTHAQVDNKVVLPSADVAKMLTPANVDVNYYTGRLSLSLPIYVIKDGDITIPISLNYYSGGVKVSETATKVGLGWDLNVGGVVSRNINGLPDEYNTHGQHVDLYRNYANQVANQIGVAHFSTQSKVADETLNNKHCQAHSFYEEYANQRIDLEPDLYTFSFMGHSGQFMKTKEGQMLFNSDSKIYPITDVGSPFRFRDIEENIYEFYSMSPTVADGYPQNIEYAKMVLPNETLDDLFPTSYYLSKLTTPTKQEAFFEYGQVSNNLEPQRNRIYAGDRHYSKYKDMYEAWQSSICTKPELVGGSSSSPLKIIRIIKQITTPNYIVEFVRDENNFREDTGTNNRIDGIKVYMRESATKKILIKNIKFNYSYFKLLHDAFNKHLRLDSLEELPIASTEKPIVLQSFDYWYTKRAIPDQPNANYPENWYHDYLDARDSDFWGYMTFNPSGTYYPSKTGATGLEPIGGFNRYPNPDYSIAGMLKQITYPTGGYTEFLWDSNKYTYIGKVENAIKPVDPIIVKKDATLEWSYSVKKQKAILSKPIKLIISAGDYYAYKLYPQTGLHVDKRDWQNHSLGELFSCGSCSPTGMCKTHKEMYDEMPVVYLGVGANSMEGVKNPFKDSRVTRVIVIDDAMILGEIVEIDLSQYDDYDIRLSPGKVRTGGDMDKALLANQGVCTVSVSYTSRVNLPTQAIEQNCGGVRISSINNWTRGNEYTYPHGPACSDSTVLKNTSKTFKYTDGVLVEVPQMGEESYTVLACIQGDETGSGNMSSVVGGVKKYRFYSDMREFSNTQGSHVGYSKVEVTESDGRPRFYTYNFSTAKDDDHQDLNESLIQVSGVYVKGLIDQGDNQARTGTPTRRDHKRGILLSKTDSTEYSVEHTKYEYAFPEQLSNYLLSGLNVYSQDVATSKIPDAGAARTRLAKDVKASTQDPDFCNNPTYTKELEFPLSDLYSTFTTYFIGRYRFVSSNKLLKKETRTETRNGLSRSTEISYTYPMETYNSDPSATLPTSVTVKDMQTEDVEKTDYTYNNRDAVNIELKNRGKVKTEVKWKNNKIISALNNEYDASGLLIYNKVADIDLENLPTSIHRLNYVLKNEFKYNGCNIARITPYNGPVTAYLWKNNLLQGQCVNVTILEPPFGIETDCLAFKQSADHAHIKCISYDARFPDKVASIEEPNGNVTYYEYDGFGRLIYVKDKSMNVLKYYKYNYRF